MTMSRHDEEKLLAYRSEFPTLSSSVHLISHSLGAMPRSARQWAMRFLDEWEGESIEAWETWLPFVRELGDTIAEVVGAPKGSIAIHQNVSTIQSMIASCFEFEAPRNRVVYSELNFSTVHYVWERQRQRGAEIVMVRARDSVHPPMEELLSAIDERTLIVPISHVLFRSSAIKDVPAIVKRAHEVGALVMLDCYQSAGVLPVKLAEWEVDIACGGSVKWACGGPGAAWVYVAPSVLPRLKPMQTGWFGHKRPFAFEMDSIDYADDVFRVMGGTPPIPALYTARAGWEIIRKIGVEAIRKKSLRQTALLRNLVEERGFRVNTPREDDARGGTICFDFEGAERASKELNARRFFHDYRPKCGLRASPHFYTTDEEIERFVREIDVVRRSVL